MGVRTAGGRDNASFCYKLSASLQGPSCHFGMAWAVICTGAAVVGVAGVAAAGATAPSSMCGQPTCRYLAVRLWTMAAALADRSPWPLQMQKPLPWLSEG